MSTQMFTETGELTRSVEFQPGKICQPGAKFRFLAVHKDTVAVSDYSKTATLSFFTKSRMLQLQYLNKSLCLKF